MILETEQAIEAQKQKVIRFIRELDKTFGYAERTPYQAYTLSLQGLEIPDPLGTLVKQLFRRKGIIDELVEPIPLSADLTPDYFSVGRSFNPQAWENQAEFENEHRLYLNLGNPPNTLRTPDGQFDLSTHGGLYFIESQGPFQMRDLPEVTLKHFEALNELIDQVGIKFTPARFMFFGDKPLNVGTYLPL